jgi:translation initiation factor 2B subunit (eIF-2B alpha/beta/delta family)
MFNKLGRTYEEVIKSLSRPNELNELQDFFSTVDSICNNQRPQKAVCLNLAKRIKGLISTQKELVEKTVKDTVASVFFCPNIRVIELAG